MVHQAMKEIHKFVIPTPFAVGPVNVYLIKGEKLTLVDVGPKTEEAWNTLTFNLAQLGYTPEDIEQIVITHHHPDHVGLIDYFSSSVPIIGHWRNRPWLKREASFLSYHDEFFAKLIKSYGAPTRFLNKGIDLSGTLKYSCQAELHIEVTEGDSIPGLPEWTVYETPGHASSHIVLYRQKDGVMIGGDHILQKISSNPLLEPPYPEVEQKRAKPLLQYRAALKKCMEINPKIVLSGHGDDVTEIGPLLEMRLRQQEKRAAMVKRWITSQPMTAFEVCQRLFPKVYEQQFALAFSETVGQLDYLLNNGEIDERNENGRIIFEVKK